MSGFKGTKGPWGITEGDPNGIELEAIRIQSLNDERWDICAVWNDLYLEESKSNALLISKAPEMLEMLETIVEATKEGGYVPIETIERLIKSCTEL